MATNVCEIECLAQRVWVEKASHPPRHGTQIRLPEPVRFLKCCLSCTKCLLQRRWRQKFRPGQDSRIRTDVCTKNAPAPNRCFKRDGAGTRETIGHQVARLRVSFDQLPCDAALDLADVRRKLV